MRIGRLLFSRFLATAAFCVLVVLCDPARAHEGHDHGPPIVVVESTLPRVEANSPDFELVGIVSAGTMLIFLDRFQDNAPIQVARIEVSDGTSAVAAERQADGSLVLRAPWLTKAGAYNLTFTITAGDISDLLVGTIVIPSSAASDTSIKQTRARSRLDDGMLWLSGGLIFLIGLVFGRLLSPRPLPPAVVETETAIAAATTEPLSDKIVDKRRVAAALVVGIVALTGLPAFASESPRRLSDGSLFVPKPTQRLLEVRTTIAKPSEVSGSHRVIGQVIADPNASGRVQAMQAGRIVPGEAGLPTLGQRVEIGQMLASITPSISALERGNLAQQLAELTANIALAQQRLTRLSQLQGSVPQREIDTVRVELDGQIKRRAALMPTTEEREIVRASASGIISVANVVAGQVVEPREILFEIIDPSRLWIEALAFDSQLRGGIADAFLLTADGSIPLSFVGRGPQLRQQAVALQFRLGTPVSDLAVGKPVSVLVRSQRMLTGIVLPLSSVVRASNGQMVVWEHIAAERFAPRAVRIESLDGERIVVVAGIEADQRIVISAAEMLNQIR